MLSSSGQRSGGKSSTSSSTTGLQGACSSVAAPKSRGPTTTTTRTTTITRINSSAGSAAKQRVPTLAMSLRDKDQQIKLLIKERDEQKFQAELMARKAEEWREKFEASELERSHVTSEADDEVVELRRLAQEFEDENKRLAVKLNEKEQILSDVQFKLDELEIDKSELKKELEDKEEQLRTMENERRELISGDKTGVQVVSERAVSKAKYEREIEDLKDKIVSRDEQLMQLRSSLEMRKNEVANLQKHSADLERKLKIETERSERHLKRIDEINLELKAAEAKLATKSEESDVLDKQVRQLRQELRSAEDKLEQMSLARKKDVDILHNKLSAARRGSTTPTSPQPYKTPTPQDEIVRLQMEIRDLKDQLIDREAELDCNRRDLEVMRRKMETRTLEVDCNNQELARRCQDLLEQNRQSEDTIKQLLKSTSEHSAQLMRSTEDLKEANGKCIKLREEVNELELKLEEQLKRTTALAKENGQLKEENEEQTEQIEILRRQVDSLNEQLSDLCQQLDIQTNNLHKDRELLADQLSQQEIDLAQLRHDLASAKQDLRTSKLQTQEVASERDRLKSDFDIKEKYIRSRNDIIETMRHELDDSRKSLSEYKQKIELLRQTQAQREQEAELSNKELRGQLETLRRDLQAKSDECNLLRDECLKLQQQFDELGAKKDNEADEKFDEMRQKHSAELDELKLKLKRLEDQLDDSAKKSASLALAEGVPSSTGQREQEHGQASGGQPLAPSGGQDQSIGGTPISRQKRDEYETQIEFLNSVVVDMQRKCDDYKNRLAQIQTINIMNEFDQLALASGRQHKTNTRASTLRPASYGAATKTSQQQQLPSEFATLARPRVVRIQDPAAPDGDTSMVGANNKQAEQHAKVHQRSARISGRPYCDTCQVYDLHHTIYCPYGARRQASNGFGDEGDDNNNNNNNNKDNNNHLIGGHPLAQAAVDEMFREYEQSLESATQFNSLRRPTATKYVQQLAGGDRRAPRPYCDHCDLFGHTVKGCNSLKV